MDGKKLKKLISSPEGPKLDFKAQFHIDLEMDKRELVKDVSAMANSKGGRGYIVYGVADKSKEVLGINLESADVYEERIQQILCSRLDPPVPVRFDIIPYEGKNLGILTIYKSGQHPHQIRQSGTFYIRRGSTTDIARRREIADMLQETGLVSFETTILYHAPISDLNEDQIKDYLSSARLPKEEINLILLEALGVISRTGDGTEYRPTVGGMLLFGNNPQQYLPHTGIEISFNQEVRLFRGNIITMVNDIQHYLNGIFSTIKYPTEAVMEAIQNAIIHRDYWDLSREIIVDIGYDKIYIENPGALWSTGSVRGLLKESNPPRRNPWLYQKLLVLDEQHRFVRNVYGMQKIQKLFPSEYKIDYYNLSGRNIFRVGLPGLRYFNSNH